METEDFKTQDTREEMKESKWGILKRKCQKWYRSDLPLITLILTNLIFYQTYCHFVFTIFLKSVLICVICGLIWDF